LTFSQKISEEIFAQKYMINGEQSAEDVFRGVAKEIASVEKTKKLRDYWEAEFYRIISNGFFIPGGRILANARPSAKMRNYNNCFTIEVEDSIPGIYKALQEDAVINAAGGGVGFNISHLRPKGAPTTKQGESSGPISFLRVFNESAKQIMTGGSRRGAHIAVMNIDHPDIEEFITCKHGEKNNELTQFNISVGISDAFINAVEKDLDWNLEFKGKIYKTVKARYLYELLATNAFEHNEPGILNLDHVNKYNTGAYAFDIETTNPCGEIPMPNYSLCCLGSINLSQFVICPFGKHKQFDYKLLQEVIPVAVRFLDNVLEATQYPLPLIEKLSKEWRRIGLGFTGLADAFAMLGISYGSEESKQLSGVLASVFQSTAYHASIDLAKEKGQFPSLDRRRYVLGDYITEVCDDGIKNRILKHGIRNVAMLTCAPTGTTSLTVGQNCSSGIEPIFSLSYDRKIRTGRDEETKTQTVYDYAYMEYLNFCERHGLPKELDAEAKPWFTTTYRVDPKDGIDIQAIFQKYIDHSISKTCNLPENYSYEKYKDLWMYAYKKGLKGFTTFNPSGSMAGILSVKKAEPKGSTDTRPEFIERHPAPRRPKDLDCDIHVSSIKGQKYLILIGKYNGSVYEMFVSEYKDEWAYAVGKTGTIRKCSKGKYDLIITNGEEHLVIDDISSAFNPEYDSVARLISTALRHGTPLEFIVEQLSKSGVFGSWTKSCSTVLKKYIREGELVTSSQACPNCGQTEGFFYREGCVSHDCGWSRCG
jgi:ribonucleoside-diphosphate reductase alpha chain